MIFEKICQMMHEKLNLDISEIKPTSLLREDLNLDSLDLVELVMAMEEEFDFQFEDDELEHISTVQEAVDYIESKI